MLRDFKCVFISPTDIPLSLGAQGFEGFLQFQ